MIVAQLSDPHIVEPGKSPRTPAGFGPVDTAGFLSRAVDALNRLDPLPDIAVITGDLVDRGEPAEYEHLRRLIARLRMPVFVIPGNHDARAPLRAAFGADGYLGTRVLSNTRSRNIRCGWLRSTRWSRGSTTVNCAPIGWLGSIARSPQRPTGRPS